MRASERNRIEKEIRRFELAAWDMDWAAGAAQTLIERVAPGARHALEVGLVVCYARPFGNTGDWAKALSEDDWAPTGENQRLHNSLLDLRDTAFAHSDRQSGRDVEDVAR